MIYKAYFLCIILNYKYLQFKQFTDDITIDLYFFRNFASMKDIKKICNPMVDLSKFTSNKMILSKVVALAKLCSYNNGRFAINFTKLFLCQVISICSYYYYFFSIFTLFNLSFSSTFFFLIQSVISSNHCFLKFYI